MSGIEIKVDVNVDNIGLQSSVGTRRKYDDDGEYEAGEVLLVDVIAQVVAEKLTKDDQYPKLRDQVLKIREEEIRAAIIPMIEKAVAAPIQKTTSYGSPVGEPTTLTELIIQTTNDILKKGIDRSGYSDSRGETLLAKLIRTEVTNAMQKELKEVIDAEKAKVVATVQKHGAALLASALEAITKK